MLRLSVLDQSTAAAGRGEDAAIRETLALARRCEALGYSRFWVSEHHDHATIAGTAPEIVVAAIAATTSRIRVGSAGVLLPHYATLKVAEQFRVLEAIAPGRIDLGVGRAPGGDRRSAYALNPNADAAADLFPSQIRDLLAWTSGADLAEGHPFRGLVAHPTGPTAPVVWVLGSSAYGAQVAAHFGLPYCFAHFITDGAGTAEALDLYRKLYRPSPRHPAPEATVCVWALAAETESEARRLFATRERWRLDRDRGILGPLLPADEAPRAAAPGEEPGLERMRGTALFGGTDQVASRLHDLARGLGLDELVVLTWTHDPAAKERSYALLAGAFGLEPAASG